MAVSDAAVEACLRMFRTRVELARLGLWKRVIGSRVLLWEVPVLESLWVGVGCAGGVLRDVRSGTS